MRQLIRLLHEGDYSCVVRNYGETRTFHRRGILDLYYLFRNDPAFLRGASVADKAVGKAAAALLVAGDIRELHADVISQGALTLLHDTGIVTTYTAEVPFIANRTRDGICPMERRCNAAQTAAECLPQIEAFLRTATPQPADNTF